MEEYKSNSHRSKNARSEERKKIDKIVTGSVKIKKKNEFQKLLNSMIPEDVGSVKSFIIMDVIIPTGKKMLSDIVDAVLYPGSSPRKRYNTDNVSYRQYSDKRDSGRNRDRARTDIYPTRNSYDHGNIVLETRGAAEEVFIKMEEIIDAFGAVSVADLCDLIGESSQYTDIRYGWTNIRNAEAVRVRDGYLLKLPKALPID